MASPTSYAGKNASGRYISKREYFIPCKPQHLCQEIRPRKKDRLPETFAAIPAPSWSTLPSSPYLHFALPPPLLHWPQKLVFRWVQYFVWHKQAGGGNSSMSICAAAMCLIAHVSVLLVQAGIELRCQLLKVQTVILSSLLFIVPCELHNLWNELMFWPAWPSQ